MDKMAPKVMRPLTGHFCSSKRQDFLYFFSVVIPSWERLNLEALHGFDI